MPGFDGTGPLGAGSMTGRGLGPCGAGYGRGWSRGFGRGLGRGYGRGFGYGRGYGARMFPWYDQAVSPTVTEEKEMLAEQIEMLEEELKIARARQSEIKNQK
jgi:hypothetical protein